MKFEISEIRARKRQEKLEDYEEEGKKEKAMIAKKGREGTRNPFI